ncbi:MAG: hypothetical protein JW395_0239 [Nitrospira sp.]|nr:hypothetical protein [Nitrospira sp.]
MCYKNRTDDVLATVSLEYIDSLPTLCYPHYTCPSSGHFATIAGDALIPYDNLPVPHHSLLGAIHIVEWSGRLGTALRHDVTLDPA